MSRKLTDGQTRWVPREQETYAIIASLEKWNSWIGMQPVLILTDHKALESWTKEVLDTPSGPIGRRARWHQMLSKYDLTVGYIPGKDNCIADVLSRWAYPASEAFRDMCKHGNKIDEEDVKAIKEKEKWDEEHCQFGVLSEMDDEWVKVDPIFGDEPSQSSSSAPKPKGPPRFVFAKPRGEVQGGGSAHTPPVPWQTLRKGGGCCAF